jgi:hypothetical protein
MVPWSNCSRALALTVRPSEVETVAPAIWSVGWLFGPPTSMRVTSTAWAGTVMV